MHNFRKNLMLVGAGGPGALQTSPEWAETVLERNFPTSAGRGWGGRNAELPQEFDARGSRRAGRPPDLLAGEKSGPG